MAATSSKTQVVASTPLLPTSLLKAQVLLAGIQSKSTLPLFFESAVFQRLQAGDYSPPLLDSQHSPDYDGSGSFPAFSYPHPSFRDFAPLFRTLQVLTDDSPSTESPEVYDVFEEAAPFLVYIRDFWIGRANCPLFAEQVLLSAESLSLGLPIFLRDNLTQQWGVPPEHRSSAEGVHKFKRFPAIPIPFCLRFREGSAMMRMVLSKDLDPFASLRGQSILPGVPKTVCPPKVSDVISPSPASKAPAVPPRALQRNREIKSLKADASSFLASPRSTHSKDSDNELLSGFPLVDAAPQASLSTKASVGRKDPKSKTTVKVVEDSKASNPTPSGMAYKRVRLPPHSRKNTSIVSKGKARQVVVSDKDLTSNEVESEDEDEDEEIAPPPKRPKMTSSISASLPRRSVKRVTVPKRVTKAAGKLAPEHSPSSTFQSVLLADAQGRLRLPEQSTGNFTPFPKFAHARNSAALSQENPLLAVNPDFIELGSILETQNAHFMMQDLMQVNRVIRNPSIPSQACVSALARGDLEANSAPLPGYKCQACSSWSLKCLGLGSLDVELAMDALNALHKASTSNLANSLRRAADLNDQLKQIGSLFDTTRELSECRRGPYRRTRGPQNCRAQSPFNLSGLDFDNRTPGEWIELLRSIHSGESTARIDKNGHLVESSPPLDSATEALEGLKEVEKGSADEGTGIQVGGSIPMELDLPTIESLAEPTLSPEKGAEQAQALES
ncbi:hypothetical protein F5877DRAFT_86092 [Lentinula edodes]|nr:hypothetical protein F5877DRAFT_86092 [Lentinula edodes]